MFERSGLGHYGIILAKALGAKRIVGISRKGDKRDDVLKMGADEYVATEEDHGMADKLVMITSTDTHQIGRQTMQNR